MPPGINTLVTSLKKFLARLKDKCSSVWEECSALTDLSCNGMRSAAKGLF